MNADWEILYTAKYARQADYSGGDARIDATYTRLGIGGQWHDPSVRIDQEVLGSNDGRYAFQFALATNHLLQGLVAADLVLATNGHWGFVLTGVTLWGIHMGITRGLLATMGRYSARRFARYAPGG